VARTQVGIVGAGPAGLMLSHLLHLRGIESIVIESQSRAYCEQRVRAGLLEQASVDLLVESGLGQRLQREALVHHGIELCFNRCRHRIDLFELTGRTVTIYGQQEVVKDLIKARLNARGKLIFEAEAVEFDQLPGPKPVIRFQKDGELHEIPCDFIAGCDGFHGVCRSSIPAGVLTTYERVYPFGWLGILAEVPPASKELVYANHERGFALLTMRSLVLSRLYLQCAPDENVDQWPDARIWEELNARCAAEAGFVVRDGPIIQKSVTALRSFVVEPMQFGRLFLAGDAAHIVPPTGAKGMNLAIADVNVLSRALDHFYRTGSEELLNGYSETCLRRVWRVQQFSWWMTYMLHRFDEDTAFEHRRQIAELEYVTRSRAAAQTLAENYAGLPLP
jgi:p-hydroxybenzoate 3-monooxygenase